MLDDIEIGLKEVDIGLRLKWRYAFKLACIVSECRSIYSGCRFLVDVVDLNPELEEIGGVKFLIDVLKSRRAQLDRTCLNRGKVKRAIKQNNNMKYLGRIYESQEQE